MKLCVLSGTRVLKILVLESVSKQAIPHAVAPLPKLLFALASECWYDDHTLKRLVLGSVSKQAVLRAAAPLPKPVFLLTIESFI